MNVSDIQMISASPAHGLRHVFALPHRTDVLLNEQVRRNELASSFCTASSPPFSYA